MTTPEDELKKKVAKITKLRKDVWDVDFHRITVTYYDQYLVESLLALINEQTRLAKVDLVKELPELLQITENGLVSSYFGYSQTNRDLLLAQLTNKEQE